MNTTTKYLVIGLAAGCAAVLNAQDTQPPPQPPVFAQPGTPGADDPFAGDTPADVPQSQQPAGTTPETPSAGTATDAGVVAPQPSGRTYVGGLPSDGPPPPEEPMPADMPQPAFAPPPLPVQPVDAYQYFYEPLAPYGEWVFIPTYGYCWRPVHTPYGWRPYWDGHWVWSECGWMWVSDEPWGWATYHYGRWTLTSEFGWMWVPGRRWAPAWVCWRQGPDFIGWAPLPPGAPVGVGFYSDAFSISIGCWTMVFERDFLSPHCRRVAFPVHHHHEFLPRATTVINVGHHHNHIVNVGPGRHHIERAAGRSVPTLRLRSAEVTRADVRVTTRVHSDAIVVHQPTRKIMAKPADLTRIKRAEKVTVVREPVTHVPPRTTLKTTTATTPHGATTRTTTGTTSPRGKDARIVAPTTTTTRTVMPDSPKSVTTSRDTRRRDGPPPTTTVQPQPTVRAKTVTPPPVTATPPITTTPSIKDTKSKGRRHDDNAPVVRTQPPARVYTPKDTPRTIAPKTTPPPPSTVQRHDATPRTRRHDDAAPQAITKPPMPSTRSFTPSPTPRVTTPPAAPTTTKTAPPPATGSSKGRRPKPEDKDAPR